MTPPEPIDLRPSDPVRRHLRDTREWAATDAKDAIGDLLPAIWRAVVAVWLVAYRAACWAFWLGVIAVVVPGLAVVDWWKARRRRRRRPDGRVDEAMEGDDDR